MTSVEKGFTIFYDNKNQSRLKIAEIDRSFACVILAPEDKELSIGVKIIAFILTLFSWKYVRIPNTNLLININSVAKHTGLMSFEIKKACFNNTLPDLITKQIPLWKKAEDTINVAKDILSKNRNLEISYIFSKDETCAGKLLEAEKVSAWLEKHASEMELSENLYLKEKDLTTLPNFLAEFNFVAIDLRKNKFSHLPEVLLKMKSLKTFLIEKIIIENDLKRITGDFLEGTAAFHERNVSYKYTSNWITINFNN